jgi:hypothetical protein
MSNWDWPRAVPTPNFSPCDRCCQKRRWERRRTMIPSAGTTGDGGFGDDGAAEAAPGQAIHLNDCVPQNRTILSAKSNCS